jgi:hypothetical protein
MIGIIVALLAAGYVVYEVITTQEKTTNIMTGTHSPGLAPGTWESTSSAPEESTPPADMVSSYQVAADHPRVLSIDRLNIRARILPMGIANDGSIQTPKNIFDAGWYTSSAKPGTTGTSFLDGHASGATRQGLLAYLDTLQAGDMMSVEKGSGERLYYKVVHVDVVPLDGIDMDKALRTYGDAEHGLNIMTCTGTWLPDKLTYDKRVIVYTQQVNM